MPEGSSSEPGLASAHLGSLLDSGEPLDGVLDTVVALARRTIGPVEHASLTLRLDGRLETTHSSSDLARRLDGCQYDDGRGPCVQVALDEGQVVTEVEAGDGRWPTFATLAHGLGVRSMCSTTLAGGPRPVGGLNLYSWTPRAFGADEVELAGILARQAGAAVVGALAGRVAEVRSRQLEDALASRETIAQAMGILMARERIDGAEAFDILRRASQRENRKLRDLAAELVDTTEHDALAGSEQV